VVHARQGAWLARSPWGGRGPAVTDPEPPLQYLHLDDLAAAVALAATARPDAVLNVAPDGWLAGEEVRALAGPAPRIGLPGPLARRLQRARWENGPAGLPAGLRPLRGAIVPFEGVLPYLTHPWVVANDALRSLGWQPSSSNAEAFVAGTPAGPLTSMTPKRRQMVALGAAVVAIGAAITGIVAAVRRANRLP
jgi:hypothetical protein